MATKKVDLYIYLNDELEVESCETFEVDPSDLDNRCICLKVKVEIPEAYFVIPTFETVVKIPEPKDGILTSWLNGGTESPVKPPKKRSGLKVNAVVRDDIPF